MRLVIAHKPLRRILAWVQRALFAGAVAALAYCAAVLVDTWSFQKEELVRFEQRLHEQAALPASVKQSLPAANGDVIGRIDIPRLGLSAIIVEGTGRTALRRAVGHIAGTAEPGQSGNVGIAGHRDTFFRPLRNVQSNDMITLTTAEGEYHYRVVSTKVTGPYDVAVLDTSEGEILTLVTCYPFYFVGFAPDRFIVRAERLTGYGA